VPSHSAAARPAFTPSSAPSRLSHSAASRPSLAVLCGLGGAAAAPPLSSPAARVRRVVTGAGRVVSGAKAAKTDPKAKPRAPHTPIAAKVVNPPSCTAGTPVAPLNSISSLLKRATELLVDPATVGRIKVTPAGAASARPKEASSGASSSASSSSSRSASSSSASQPGPPAVPFVYPFGADVSDTKLLGKNVFQYADAGGQSVVIYMFKGAKTLIDSSCLERLGSGSWRYSSWFRMVVRTKPGKGGKTFLHRVVHPEGSGSGCIMHINGDNLDNRSVNLVSKDAWRAMKPDEQKAAASASLYSPALATLMKQTLWQSERRPKKPQPSDCHTTDAANFPITIANVRARLAGGSPGLVVMALKDIRATFDAASLSRVVGEGGAWYYNNQNRSVFNSKKLADGTAIRRGLGAVLLNIKNASVIKHLNGDRLDYRVANLCSYPRATTAPPAAPRPVHKRGPGQTDEADPKRAKKASCADVD